MFGQAAYEKVWPGPNVLPIASLRPKAVDRLLVLGGCADVSRSCAEKLLRPLALIELGTRLGRTAAEEAATIPTPVGVRLRGTPAQEAVADGDVGEFLAGLRPVRSAGAIDIEQDARALPVLGQYDVVVIGGGTAGAPAGIAAARQGAKTLVVEKLCGLGGVGTTGAISSYYHGNRVGFTSSIGDGTSWIIEQRMQWYRKELLDAGADIWFSTIGCGAFVGGERDNEVLGAVVVSPRGRGVILADVVIDATGNADIAAAGRRRMRLHRRVRICHAGHRLATPVNLAPPTRTPTTPTRTKPTWSTSGTFSSTPERSSRPPSISDNSSTRVSAAGSWGTSPLRSSTRSPDARSPTRLPKAASNYDTHGYTVEPYTLLRHPLRQKFTSDIPYRSLLPRDYEGLIVTGIGLSAHRDAQPIVRMQPDVQNTGYAAGAAAAMASRERVGVREIDIRKLQRHLVEIGNLHESVLTDVDSYPLTTDRIEKAVDTLIEDYRSLAVILGHIDTSIPLLQQAYRASEGEKKLAYAKTLAMLGDETGVETLVESIDGIDQWEAPPAYNILSDYPGAVHVGWGMSQLDNTLVALGRSGSSQALPAVLKKLAMLGSDNSFSHYRAVGLALESIGDPRAAKPLAELLRKPKMGGYAATSIEDRTASHTTCRQANRELLIARALYRCGDWEGLAEQTLRAYTHDLRGHYARHAKAVLEAGKDYRLK